MHVSSLSSALSLDPNSYFSPINHINNNNNNNKNPNFSNFPNFNWNWNWVFQLVITTVILGFGFRHFLRSTASKYFAVDSAAMSAGAGGGKGCAACGKSADTWCSACKKVYYCSKTCQTQHWRSEHKKNCKGSSSKLKPQQHKAGKSKSFVALVPNSGSHLVDKVLFPYDDFVKLFNCDMQAFMPCGLLNCGNSCFANVVLQCLVHTQPLVAYLLKRGHRINCKRNQWCFLCELEVHMDMATISQRPFSPMNILSRLPAMGGDMGDGKQEDAHEFMRFAIDMMQSVCLDEHGGEKYVVPKSQETTLIQYIFGGQLRSQVECKTCHQVSNQYEHMMDLAVEIQGDATSLEECLEQFTAEECLDGENKYKCDRCEGYVNARKRLTIHQAPNILTVSLKRFEGGFFGKINKKITFPESLVLSPYMSEERDGTDIYELYAVIVHIDMLNASFFGHYICYTKSFLGDWYWIDDSKVTRVELDEVLSQGAYMLLYRRISARPPCLKTSEAPAKKDQERVNMVTVGENSSSSQLASSSNSFEPSCSRSQPSEDNVPKVASLIEQQLNRVNGQVEHSLRVDCEPGYQSLEETQTVNHVSDLPASVEILRNNLDASTSQTPTCAQLSCQVSGVREESNTGLNAHGDTICQSSGAALVADETVSKIEEHRSEDVPQLVGNTETSAVATINQTVACELGYYGNSSDDSPNKRSGKRNKTETGDPRFLNEETDASLDGMELSSVELDEPSHC